MDHSLTLLLLVSLATFQFIYGTKPDLSDSEKKKMVYNECMKNNSLTEENVRVLLSREYVVTQNEKCFLGCLFEYTGVIIGNRYNWTAHHALSPEGTWDRMTLEGCEENAKYLQNDDKCELAYEITTCLYNELLKIRKKVQAEENRHVEAGVYPSEFNKPIN